MNGKIDRSEAQSAKIGILGGTFDPPHIAHLILAAEALDQLQLARVLWVLTPVPPHKKNQSITSLEQRLEMVKLAIQDNADFEISRVDIDRPPPHFAVDTMRLLAKQYPENVLVYLMGGDSLHDLPTWERPNDFIAACDAIGVMRRSGDHVDIRSLENELPGIRAKARFIPAPLVEISGSQIRERIREDRAFRYYLHPAVYKLIQSQQLYRRKSET